MITSKWFNTIPKLAILFLVPAIIATLLNFNQWSYWFMPPSLDPLVDQFSSVENLGYYDLESNDRSSEYIITNGDPSLGSYGFDSTPSRFIIDYDMYRIPRWAQDEGITSIKSLDNNTLIMLEQMISELDWSIRFSDNADMSDVLLPYSSALYPVGYVVKGEDPNGNSLMLISMINVISGDSYRYNEALFEITSTGFNLLETNTYNYDSAGIEFAQWPFWFFVVFLISYILLMTSEILARFAKVMNKPIAVQS